MDCTKVRDRLFNIFDQQIICRIGSAWKVEYNASNENYEQADMAVYIHKKNQIAVVWNLLSRRRNNSLVKSYSLSDSWEEIIPQKGELKAVYKKMGRDKLSPYEKVLVLDVETLDKIAEQLNIYLQVNPDDKEFPENLKKDDSRYNFSPLEIRGRVSTTKWERDRTFRYAVLENYGKKCAICRCNEEKLLEAAHIDPVAAGGTDDPKNGICLCANHHIMFDKELIKIDFNKLILCDAKENVKAMPWYSVFEKSYGGRLISPKFK